MSEKLQIVYLMTARGSEEFYIGSTVGGPKTRLRTHKFDSMRRDSKVNKWIRKVGAHNLVLIPLITKTGLPLCELRSLEKFAIERYSPTLNMFRPTRTREEYLVDLKRLSSRKVTCDCGGVYRRDQITKHEKTSKHAIALVDKLFAFL